MTKLLTNESPLQVLPQLAATVGLNEAIILQQVHYLTTNPNIKSGVKTALGSRWIRKSHEYWRQDYFPFWGIATVKRAFNRLEKEGYLVSAILDHGKDGLDQTKWYTVDYDKLAEKTEALQRPDLSDNDVATRTDQNDPMDTNMIPSYSQPAPDQQSNHRIKMESPTDQNDPTLLDSSLESTSKTHDLVTEVEGDELEINFELPPHLHGTLKDKWVFYRDDSGNLVPAVVTSVSEQQLVLNAQGIGVKRVVDPAKRVYYQNGGPGLSPVEVGGYEPSKAKGEPMTPEQKAVFDTYLKIMPKANFAKIPKWQEAEWFRDLSESAKGAVEAGFTPADFEAFENWYKGVRWADSESPPPLSLKILRNNWNAFLTWRKKSAPKPAKTQAVNDSDIMLTDQQRAALETARQFQEQ